MVGVTKPWCELCLGLDELEWLRFFNVCNANRKLTGKQTSKRFADDFAEYRGLADRTAGQSAGRLAAILSPHSR